MKNPPRIDSFIRRNVIEPTSLDVIAAAETPSVSRVSLSSLLNEKARQSAEMALRMGKAFGVETVLLIDMQTGYEIA